MFGIMIHVYVQLQFGIFCTKNNLTKILLKNVPVSHFQCIFCRGGGEGTVSLEI